MGQNGPKLGVSRNRFCDFLADPDSRSFSRFGAITMQVAVTLAALSIEFSFQLLLRFVCPEHSWQMIGGLHSVCPEPVLTNDRTVCWCQM